MMASARVPTPAEDDPKARVTKKVKTREDDGDPPNTNMEETSSMATQANYREALLNTPGNIDGNDLYLDELKDAELSENRWYKDPEDEEEAIQRREGMIPIINISDKELEEWCNDWEHTVVVNVMGKKINFRVLENKINRDWARKGKVTITDLPRGYYVVKFHAVDDYRHVLFEGSWMVADHYLLVQRWRPNFLKSARRESKVAVWVRIPELPLELYNDKFFKRVGSALGVLLKIDRLTSIHSRGQFARICVQIDLNKPLVPQVEVRGELISLEYEGLHSVCFNYRIYGHRATACKLAVPATVVPEPQVAAGMSQNAVVMAADQGSTRADVDMQSENQVGEISALIEDHNKCGKSRYR